MSYFSSWQLQDGILQQVDMKRSFFCFPVGVAGVFYFLRAAMFYFLLCWSGLSRNRFPGKWPRVWSSYLGLRAPPSWDDVVSEVLGLWNPNVATEAWCRACVCQQPCCPCRDQPWKVRVGWALRDGRCVCGSEQWRLLTAVLPLWLLPWPWN